MQHMSTEMAVTHGEHTRMRERPSLSWRNTASFSESYDNVSSPPPLPPPSLLMDGGATSLGGSREGAVRLSALRRESRRAWCSSSDPRRTSSVGLTRGAEVAARLNSEDIPAIR